MYGGIVEHFRSSGIRGISHAWGLNAIAVCCFYRSTRPAFPCGVHIMLQIL